MHGRKKLTTPLSEEEQTAINTKVDAAPSFFRHHSHRSRPPPAAAAANLRLIAAAVRTCELTARRPTKRAQVGKYRLLSSKLLQARAVMVSDPLGPAAVEQLASEMLPLQARLLRINPDFYTLWNHRKEVLKSRIPHDRLPCWVNTLIPTSLSAHRSPTPAPARTAAAAAAAAAASVTAGRHGRAGRGRCRRHAPFDGQVGQRRRLPLPRFTALPSGGGGGASSHG